MSDLDSIKNLGRSSAEIGGVLLRPRMALEDGVRSADRSHRWTELAEEMTSTLTGPFLLEFGGTPAEYGADLNRRPI